MDSYIVPILIGIVCVVSGIFNCREKILSIHWYHRNRVAEENRISFGKMMGLGMIIIGLSMIVFGVLVRAAELTENNRFILVGVGIWMVGMIAGVVLNGYAIRKYNKDGKG